MNKSMKLIKYFLLFLFLGGSLVAKSEYRCVDYQLCIDGGCAGQVISNYSCFVPAEGTGGNINIEQVCMDDQQNITGYGEGECPVGSNHTYVWMEAGVGTGAVYVRVPLSDSYFLFIGLLAGYAFFLYRRKKKQQLA